MNQYLYWTKDKQLCQQFIESETDTAIKLVNWARPIPKEHIDTGKSYCGKYYFSTEQDALNFLDGKYSFSGSTYQLLDRLRSDCEYYLDNKETPDNNHLWGKTPSEHISKMYELYDRLPSTAKPMWLSRSDIDAYAKAML